MHWMIFLLFTNKNGPVALGPTNALIWLTNCLLVTQQNAGHTEAWKRFHLDIAMQNRLVFRARNRAAPAEKALSHKAPRSFAIACTVKYIGWVRITVRYGRHEPPLDDPGIIYHSFSDLEAVAVELKSILIDTNVHQLPATDIADVCNTIWSRNDQAA